MSFHDEIYVSQVLYTNKGYPVIITSKTDDTIIVRFKQKFYNIPITLVGERLHFVPPLCSTVEEIEHRKSSICENGSTIEMRSAESSNKTKAFVDKIINSDRNGTQKPLHEESKNGDGLDDRNDPCSHKHRQYKRQVVINPRASKQELVCCTNEKEHNVTKGIHRSYSDSPDNYAKYSSAVRAQSNMGKSVKGGWIASYEPNYPKGDDHDIDNYLTRTEEFMKDVIVRGNNSNSAGPRLSTTKGYSQQYHDRIISKKGKRR